MDPNLNHFRDVFLGRKLGIKLVETEQHDKGLSWLEKAAESDHGEAQFHLATSLVLIASWFWY